MRAGAGGPERQSPIEEVVGLFVPSPQHHCRSQNQLPPHQLPQSACHLWSLSEPPGKAPSDQLHEPKGTKINTAVCEFHPFPLPPSTSEYLIGVEDHQKQKPTRGQQQCILAPWY